MPTMPNFLVIGVAKCGTTSVHAYLSQHPQVFMSAKKEPQFFEFGEPEQTPLEFPARSWAVQTLQAYQALFEDVKDEKAIGEATPSNFNGRACQRIHQYLPNAKFICLLRQPVDRQYSAFVMRRRDGAEPIPDFAAAYRAGPERWSQRETSRLQSYRGADWYVERMQDWFTRFDRHQFHIGLYDELKEDAGAYMRQVYAFLEVDDGFTPDVSIIYNKGRDIRSQALRRFLRQDSQVKRLAHRVMPQAARKLSRWLRDWNYIPTSPLDPQMRRELTALQREDILRLQDLIGRDLSRWLA